MWVWRRPCRHWPRAAPLRRWGAPGLASRRDRSHPHRPSAEKPGNGIRRNLLCGGRKSGKARASSLRREISGMLRRLLPDQSSVCSRTLSKRMPGNHARRMTRQRAAGRIDQHQLPSPAAHAGLGIARVVVGHDEVDANLAGHALFGCCYDCDRAVELRAGWQQGRPVL